MSHLPTTAILVLVSLALSGCSSPAAPHAGTSRFTLTSGVFPADFAHSCYTNMEKLDAQSRSAFGMPVVATCVPAGTGAGHYAARRRDGDEPAVAAVPKLPIAVPLQRPPAPSSGSPASSAAILARVDAQRLPLPPSIKRHARDRRRSAFPRLSDPLIPVKRDALPLLHAAPVVPVTVILPRPEPRRALTTQRRLAAFYASGS